MATGKVCVEGGSEETFEFICTWCKDTKIVEAEKYCGICEEHYCLVCADSHKRVPSLKGHVLLGKVDDNVWGKQSKSLSIPTERCERHPGKLVELFCGQHKELCCHICVSLDHRICEGMVYIAEAAKGIDESEDFKTVINYLGEIKADLKKSTSKQQASLETSRCDILEQIAIFRNRTNEIFDDLEKKLANEMDMLVRDSSSRHIEYQKACDHILLEIQQLQEMLESDRQTNEPQTFINMKKCQCQIPRVNQAIEELPSQHGDDRLLFEIDLKLKSFIDSLISLGTVTLDSPMLKTISISQSATGVPTVSHGSSQRSNVSLQTAHPLPLTQNRFVSNTTRAQEATLLKVSRYTKYNIKMSSDDRKCYIESMCMMSNGAVLLTDHTNCNIKLLNSDYQIISHLAMPAFPLQVCPISDDEFVVASNDNLLNFVTIQNNALTLKRSVTLNHLCLGVAYSSERLYVSDGNTKVYVHTIEGNHIQTLELDCRNQNMFTNTRKLYSSENCTNVFVADDKKGIVVLDKQGNMLSTYEDEDLLEADDVYVDIHGRVLVCYFESNNIMQLNKEGTKSVNEIVKLNSYEKPLSVCIDHERKKMLVSISKNNFVRVYDIDNL